MHNNSSSYWENFKKSTNQITNNSHTPSILLITNYVSCRQEKNNVYLIRLDNTAFTFSNSFLILKSDKEKWNSHSLTLSNSPLSKQFNKVHIILPGSNLCEILFLKSVAIRVTYPNAVVPLLSCLHLRAPVGFAGTVAKARSGDKINT